MIVYKIDKYDTRQHTNAEITSWDQYFNDINSLVQYSSIPSENKNVKKNLQDYLFNLKFEISSTVSKTNYEVIKNDYLVYVKMNFSLSDEDRTKYIQILESNDEVQITSLIMKLGILEGILLRTPLEKCKITTRAILGRDILVEKKIGQFVIDEWQKIQSDTRFVSVFGSSKNGELVHDLSSEIQVLIWNRASGKLINISRSITSISTNVTETGGNFSLQVSIPQLDPSTLDLFKDESFSQNRKLQTYSTFSEDIVSGNLQSLLKYNDLVFIRYENLDIESNTTQLAGKVWEMIGLVDQSPVTSSPTEISMTVSGRDLVKVLIDDQSYFYPLKFATSVQSMFGGITREGTLFKRLFSSGKYENTFVFSLRSIENTISFIINQISNLTLLPDNLNLFQEYGDRLSKEYLLTEDGVLSETATVKKGVWGIIKVLIDKEVSHYRIADPSISQPDGSLLSQFNKLCQRPFVEFITDTYGDQFYLIARKPPFDYQSLKWYLKTLGAIVDIETIDVLEETLDFETEFPTFIELVPQGYFFGSSQTISLAFLPILFLEEYAKVWGSKRLRVISNYIDYSSLFGSKGEENYSDTKRKMIDDLAFLIETNAYRPFTRTGTIKINGDRRIKRGHYIRYKKTGEIFYVDGVKNSASMGTDSSLERTTTLNISRGMVEEYILKDESKSIDSKRKASKSSEIVDFTLISPGLGSQSEEDFLSKGSSSRKESSSTGSTLQSVVEDEFSGDITISKLSVSYFNIIDIEYVKKALYRNFSELEKGQDTIKKVNSDIGIVVVKQIFDFFLRNKQFQSQEGVQLKPLNSRRISNISNPIETNLR